MSYRIADSRSSPRDGAYVHGLLMEGARWDVQAGIIMDSRLKDLFPPMPVIYVRVRINLVFLEIIVIIVYSYIINVFTFGYHAVSH